MLGDSHVSEICTLARQSVRDALRLERESIVMTTVKPRRHVEACVAGFWECIGGGVDENAGMIVARAAHAREECAKIRAARRVCRDAAEARAAQGDVGPVLAAFLRRAAPGRLSVKIHVHKKRGEPPLAYRLRERERTRTKSLGAKAVDEMVTAACGEAMRKADPHATWPEVRDLLQRGVSERVAHSLPLRQSRTRHWTPY